MFKSLSIPAILALTFTSNATFAAPTPSTSFVHDGKAFTYSVEQKDDTRIIRGTAGPNGQPFVLYVTGKKISGTVNGRYVSFSRSDVTPLAKDTLIAAR